MLDNLPGGRARTLAELGRLAGVSAGTASRALADSPLVNAKTRELIKSLATAHNFRPNLVARRLRTGRSGLVAIVVPLGHETRQHISDPFFMAILGQLADSLTENGREILLSRAVPTAPDWLDRVVESGLIDGVLLIGQSDQDATIARVAARYRPLVVWGEVAPEPAYCTVGSDNMSGGRMAAEHLIERGSRRIAFMGDTRLPEVAARHAGCAAATTAAGLAAPLVLTASLAAEVIEREVAAHLDRHGDDFDAIFAASDVIAIAALRVLADRRVAVPQAVRVIGYDDLPQAMQTVPRLTTVRQNIAGGAARMIDLLLRRIDGADPVSCAMPVELIARETT